MTDGRPMTPAQRQRARRERLRKTGATLVQVTLSAEGVAALQRLQASGYASTASACVERALTEAARTTQNAP